MNPNAGAKWPPFDSWFLMLHARKRKQRLRFWRWAEDMLEFTQLADRTVCNVPVGKSDKTVCGDFKQNWYNQSRTASAHGTGGTLATLVWWLRVVHHWRITFISNVQRHPHTQHSWKAKEESNTSIYFARHSFEFEETLFVGAGTNSAEGHFLCGLYSHCILVGVSWEIPKGY